MCRSEPLATTTFLSNSFSRMRMILDYDAQTKGISVGEESVLPEAHSSSRDELLELHYKVGVLTKGHGP